METLYKNIFLNSYIINQLYLFFFPSPFLLSDIYRLDRLTSGVLICAKTSEKTRELEDQILNKSVQKEYVCRVVGKFPE